MFPPGLEPGTFRVLGERDNHYTTETLYTVPWFGYINYNIIFSIEVMDPRRMIHWRPITNSIKSPMEYWPSTRDYPPISLKFSLNILKIRIFEV